VRVELQYIMSVFTGAESPELRILAIFDVFDDWFHEESFQGCLFVTSLLETFETNNETSSIRAEAVGALELTITQIKFLHYLEQTVEPLTLKEAAALVSLSLPAASRAVEDLVRRGFAERHEDLADRRMKRVAITPAGREVMARVNATRLAAAQQFAATLTEAERKRLAGALAPLLERPEIAACLPEGASS